VWVWPSPNTWLILFGMGLVAGIGNFAYVHALRIADASLSMPADYVRLLWMVGWGFALCRDPGHVDLGRRRVDHNVYAVHYLAGIAPGAEAVAGSCNSGTRPAVADFH